MKNLLCVTLLTVCTIAPSIHAKESKPLVYVNQNVGFNIEGYDYQQPALPCDVDNKLVDLLVKKGEKAGINIQAVENKEQINNGITPVVLIDIEQLHLSEAHTYGKNSFNVPTIQITAGILKNKALTTAKHTCTAAQSNPSMLSTDVVEYNHPGVSVCTEAQKCLEDLSTDVIGWLKPQVK